MKMNINCKGKLIDISSPKVMGVLNLTPDSFYDGNKFNNEKKILNQVEKMLNDGATLVNFVGGLVGGLSPSQLTKLLMTG